MDSLAAAPGTGPATSPMPILRRRGTGKGAQAVRRGVDALETLPAGRTLVMGILNVTPDSFSDGGRHATADAAIRHGLQMLDDGADIIDVGGESTRPNADFVGDDEEQRRILPVVEALVRAGAVVSVDTMHAATAAICLEAGAAIINDVSGPTFDPDMPALIAKSGVPYVLMHGRGNAKTMNDQAQYDDVVEDVLRELTEVRDAFLAAGVAKEQIILDPGLGFAKKTHHNWELLRSLDRFEALGHRVLVGASRKRFLGALLARDGEPVPPTERDVATAAVTALSAAAGAWGVRVHDVSGNLDAVKAAVAWTGPSSKER